MSIAPPVQPFRPRGDVERGPLGRSSRRRSAVVPRILCQADSSTVCATTERVLRLEWTHLSAFTRVSMPLGRYHNTARTREAADIVNSRLSRKRRPVVAPPDSARPITSVPWGRGSSTPVRPGATRRRPSVGWWTDPLTDGSMAELRPAMPILGRRTNCSLAVRCGANSRCHQADPGLSARHRWPPISNGRGTLRLGKVDDSPRTP